MFLRPISIEKNSFVSELVRQDYRTAGVFRKYDIDFCCGGKWALGMMCEMKGLDFASVKEELENAVRTVQLSNSLRYEEWDTDFLTEYIVNIHHQYLREALPKIKDHLGHFVEDHKEKYPYLEEVQKQFNYLYKDSLPHLQEEEEILFPYIRQIAHAYESKESYASLLVRTLRKPVENVMQHEHETVSKMLRRLRELTNNYTPPEDACVSHRVAFSMLKELDNDLAQHVYLENNILFPKAVAMEKELLQHTD
jgi:regulator of cell morphogenesis and NO signaling